MRNTFSGRVRVWTALALLLTGMPAGLATTMAQTRGSLEPTEVEDGAVPLTLREALALALDNSLAIAVQRYEPRVSENAILGARGVFDPSISFFAQKQDQTSLSANPFAQSDLATENDIRVANSTFTDPLSTGGTLTVALNANRFATADPAFAVKPIFNTNVTFTYDQSLLRNFGYNVNTTGIRIARRNVDISESQFRQVVIDIIQAVEKAYWDLKFAREDLAVKRHSQALSEETLSQNRIRVDVGTMAPIDVTTAEAEVASRRQDVLLAENTLENAKDSLLLFLNQPRTSPLWVLPINPVDELPFDDEMTIDLEAAFSEAMSSRPDLEQTRLLQANDEDLVAQAKDGLRHDLALRAQYTRAGISFRSSLGAMVDQDVFDAYEQIYKEHFNTWLVSLNYTIPLGNKAAKSAYLDARLRQEQRREIVDDQELNALILVRNSVRAVLNTVERVKAAEVNVRLQRERLEAENKRYENGMTTTFDLFQFQDDLTRAQSQVILALVDFNKALTDLEASKGTLASARGVRMADLSAGGTEVALP